MIYIYIYYDYFTIVYPSFHGFFMFFFKNVLTPPFPLETGLESQESVRLVGRNDDFFQLEVLVQPPIDRRHD